MLDSHIPASKSTIMVVDDNPDIVDNVRLTLEQKGFNVTCAYSGKELFAGLGKRKPDLILLDIMMPQMDGLEVLVRLRRNPGTASIPIILLTAIVYDENVQRGYEYGADYYVKKPFDTFNLLAGINFLLGRRNTQPSLLRASAYTQLHRKLV